MIDVEGQDGFESFILFDVMHKGVGGLCWGLSLFTAELACV